MKNAPSDYRIHVISNTHWDREWLYSFQETRMMLVDMMDHLLEILKRDKNYRHYHLDSQTVLLEDYLAIRPEKKELLKRFIKEGRILVGPWYTLPDEFPVNGEALVRNLLRGHRIAAEFGKVMKVGYTPFSFGQISQLPQLYAGFGIDTILFYRGCGGLYLVKMEFIWEGADGTRALCSRFGSYARYKFFFKIFRPVVYGKEWEERVFTWREGGLPFHLCNLDSYRSHYIQLDPPEFFHRERIVPSIENTIKIDEPEATTNVLLWAQGMDSTEPHPAEPRLIRDANQLLGRELLIHSSLPAYIKELKRAIKNLEVVTGEMRHSLKGSPGIALVSSISSTRVHLKQRNTIAEDALIRWAEPFACFLHALGEEYPARYLDLAWEMLLQNHPHDNIGGCGVDVMHEDMEYRFRQVEEIANNLAKRSFQRLALRVDLSLGADDSIWLMVFNPSPHARTELVTAVVEIPKEQFTPSFSIEDSSGKSVPLQIVSMEAAESVLRQPKSVTMAVLCYRCVVHFEAREVPALGYKVFRVRQQKVHKHKFGSQVIAANTMENEFLRVKINPNGTFDITDKQTARTFAGLHYFEDSGEAGHAWEHTAPERDRILNSLGCQARIALEDDGPLSTTFSVSLTMDIPTGLARDRLSRSDETTATEITSWITLRKGARRVDIRTKFFNAAKEHRLRVVFPTGVAAATVSHADTPFDVVARPIPREDTSSWEEPAPVAHPFLTFVDVSDGKHGVALLCKGLHEYEVSDNPERAIALTFLRAFEMALCTVTFRWERLPEQTGSQCLREHCFEYAIYPHRGDWAAAEVFRHVAEHNLPFRVAQCGGSRTGSLPKELGFLAITPANLILSGIKKSERRNAFIVRVFNPTEKEMRGKIHSAFDIKKARLVNLNEEFVADLSTVSPRTLSLRVPRKKIVSIELFLER